MGQGKMGKLCWSVALSAWIVTSSLSVWAAPDVSQRPDAGKTLEGLKQTELPLPQKKEDNLKVEEAVRPPLQVDLGMKIMVNEFRFSGDVLFSEAELWKLVDEGKGKELALPDLQRLAEKITAHYQSSGYLVARAYLPAQHIEKGVVEIAILAGKYDKITLNNQTKVRNDSVQLQLGSVRSGAYIEKKALERAVWLISDLSGVEAKATLAPGAQTGTSDLILNILPKGVHVSGSVSYDNYGNRFTGQNQIVGSVTILNPVRKGDALSVNATTTGSGLNSGAVTYAFPVFAQGGKMELNVSHMKYELGADFASLDASGTADSVGVNYIYNLHRSRKSNFYGQIGFTHKKLQDSVSGVITDKGSNVWNVGVNGDLLDNFGGGGANSYSAMYSFGRLSIDSDVARSNDATTANTNGSYGKWNFSAARQQYINDRLSLMMFWTGQLARKNLDSSEKISLGGAYGIRAYPKGEASGDEGSMLINELRWTIPMPEKKGILQLIGFYDTGTVKVNKETWDGATSPNRRTLHGAGMGLIWNDPGKTMIRMHYAWKVGSEEATSDTDKNGRLWAQVTKYF